MKKIYIVLIKAHTGLGSIARSLTGYEYTHAAVSMDRKMKDFLSFSRKSHYLPFDAGFMHEKRDYYSFGKHNFFKAKIFCLNVREKNYVKVQKFFEICENDNELVFDIFSMATMPVFHGFSIYKAYNCMSFTAKTLELCGVMLSKPYYRYSIKDIDELLAENLCFEGNIKRTASKGYNKYMKKHTISENIHYGVKLICELNRRRKMNL